LDSNPSLTQASACRLLRGRGRQERLNCSKQVTHVYWFSDIGITSAAQGVRFVGWRYEAGHGNDRDVLCLVIFLQQKGSVEPGDVRQINIHHDQIGLLITSTVDPIPTL